MSNVVASFCYSLIIQLVFFNILSSVCFLFSVLCILCFCIVLCILCFCIVLCIVSPFVLSLLLLYKSTNHCHQVETKLQ